VASCTASHGLGHEADHLIANAWAPLSWEFAGAVFGICGAGRGDRFTEMTKERADEYIKAQSN
jgi:hypothetical protein